MNPAQEILTKQTKSKTLKHPIITFEEVRAFCSFLEDGTLRMQRDRALICATFFCTLKTSEATALKRSDVLLNNEGSYLKVTGKRMQQRHISIPKYASKIIYDYIEKVPELKSDSFLFCTFVGKSKRVKDGQVLDGDAARKSLARSQLLFMGKDNWTYNLIRQGGIIYLVQSGAKLRELIKCTGLTVAALEKYLLIDPNFDSH